MFVHDENDFYYNGLAPGEWDKARARIIRRAEAARAQALRDLAGVVLRPLRIAARAAAAPGAAAARAAGWWRASARRGERNAAMRELHALDDRELKDIGITRSEIWWVVGGQDDARLRDATIAATRSRQRDPAAGTGMTSKPQPSGKPPIKKCAA